MIVRTNMKMYVKSIFFPKTTMSQTFEGSLGCSSLSFSLSGGVILLSPVYKFWSRGRVVQVGGGGRSEWVATCLCGWGTASLSSRRGETSRTPAATLPRFLSLDDLRGYKTPHSCLHTHPPPLYRLSTASLYVLFSPSSPPPSFFFSSPNNQLSCLVSFYLLVLQPVFEDLRTSRNIGV